MIEVMCSSKLSLLSILTPRTLMTSAFSMPMLADRVWNHITLHFSSESSILLSSHQLWTSARMWVTVSCRSSKFELLTTQFASSAKKYACMSVFELMEEGW